MSAANTDQANQADTASTPQGSRRDLLSKGAVAAAVAAVAGVASSRSAHANDGDTLIVGTSHTGTSTTKLSGGSTFWVEGGSSEGNASVYGSQGSTQGGYGVRGRHTGTLGVGVYGDATATDAVGVYGNVTGPAAYGVRGRHGGTGGVGVYGEAAGTSATGVLGQVAGIGAYGVRGSHSGSGGVGVRGDAAGTLGIGVLGEVAGASATGVRGSYTGSSGGNGVVGASARGVGVIGTADTGTGVIGRGTAYDLLADGNGRIGLTKAGATGASAPGTAGTIARDAEGDLWYCYATDTWQKLTRVAGPELPPSPLSFIPIAPVRVYDSRIAAIPESGALDPGSVRKVSVKDGRNGETGAVETADAVPAGAKAIVFNVTGTNTTAPSFLAVVPGDVSESAVSTLNWTGPGVSIANASIVGIDANRDVNIIAGPGGTFDAIIDVTGYYI